MAKIVRSAHFRCTEGTSDKVYAVALTEEAQGYLVITAYGPTGGHMTRGTKTPQPVTLEKAEKEFLSVITSRLKKNYVETPGATDNIFDIAA